MGLGDEGVELLHQAEHPADPQKPGQLGRRRPRLQPLHRPQTQARLFRQLLLRQVARQAQSGEAFPERLQEGLVRHLVTHLHTRQIWRLTEKSQCKASYMACYEFIVNCH
jgi:hypothetical protein